MSKNYFCEKTGQYICKNCHYYTSNKSNFMKHLSTAKHIAATLGTKVAPIWHQKYFCESTQQYICSICDYNTSKQSNFTKHLSTPKHINATFGTKVAKSISNNNSKKYSCVECNKEYKHKSSLYKHIKRHHNILNNNKSCRKKDKKNNNNSSAYIKNKVAETTTHLQNNNTIIMSKKEYELTLECSKLKGKLEALETTHSVVNNNVQYKSVNIHMYLNEHYKNAMNFNDFMNNLQLTKNDIYYTYSKGYVNGINNILLKNLKDLDIQQRPIHCIKDNNSKKIYVKDKNIWEKDNGNLDNELSKLDKLQLKECSNLCKKNISNDEEFLKIIKELTSINNIQREQIKNFLKKHLEIKID